MTGFMVGKCETVTAEDIAAILNADIKQKSNHVAIDGSVKPIANENSITELEKKEAGNLNLAFNKFSKKVTDASVLPDANERKQALIALRSQRDAVQDKFIIASNNRCGFYEQNLKRTQSTGSMLSGIITTATGGAGAIFSHSSQVLSGIAGISSGIGAEFQKDLFSNLASGVIIPGIEKRRANLLNQIVSNRCLSPVRYTAGMAIADAIAYHEACSMDTGIIEAGKALKVADTNTIGLETALIVQAKMEKNDRYIQLLRSNHPIEAAKYAPTTETPTNDNIIVPTPLDNTNGVIHVDCSTVQGALEYAPDSITKAADAIRAAKIETNDITKNTAITGIVQQAVVDVGKADKKVADAAAKKKVVEDTNKAKAADTTAPKPVEVPAPPTSPTVTPPSQ